MCSPSTGRGRSILHLFAVCLPTRGYPILQRINRNLPIQFAQAAHRPIGVGTTWVGTYKPSPLIARCGRSYNPR